MMQMVNKNEAANVNAENEKETKTIKNKIKTFSDYKGEDAIDLWVDMLDPITNIMADKSLLEMRKIKNVKIGNIAKELLKTHKKDVTYIITRIDPTPINGLNIVTRLIGLIADLSNSDVAKDFFGTAGASNQETSDESSISATENTEGVEN